MSRNPRRFRILGLNQYAMVSFWFAAIVVGIPGSGFTATAKAQMQAPQWLVGQSDEVSAKLGRRLTVDWKGVSLRDVFNRLEKTLHVPFWIDRRVDSSMEVEVSASNITLQEILVSLTQNGDLGFSLVGDVVYVGPKNSAKEIRTLRALAFQRTEQLDRSVRPAMRRRFPLEIKRLATPRSVFESLTKRVGVEVKNVDVLPHDLWPAASYPSMPTVEQLNLALVGFDLTWEPVDSGKAIVLKPIERPVVVERPLPLNENLSKIRLLQQQEPSIKILTKKNQKLLIARVEEHEMLLRGRQKAKRREKQNPKGKPVYSLRIAEQPAGPVLKQLAERLDLKLELLDGVAADSAPLQKRISFEVTEASIEELFEALASAADVSIQLDGDRLIVRPRSGSYQQ